MVTPTPDGIDPQPPSPSARHANPLPLIILVAILVVAALGLLGGYPARSRTIDTDKVELSVTTPETLRNGMVFETIVEVSAKRPLRQLAIGISDSLWREMTINTMVPAAESEEYGGGFHRFVFTGLKAGETFRFKIDGQINPPLLGGAHGEVVAFDGDQRLAGVPIRVRVLP